MPKTSLKLWLHDAHIIKAPVIIRGLIHNSFKETTHTMADLVKDNPTGVQIDPLLFKKYNIQKVPAVVVTNQNEFNVIYGDVTLDYALNVISHQNNLLSSIAEDALRTLKEAKHG